MEEIALKMDSSWVIMGHFNCVLNRDERIGSIVREVEILPFRRCVISCGLEDLKSTGCFFTWNNKQFGEHRVCKLDRVLCNDKWCDIYPQSEAWFMPEGIFDHTPMIFNVLAKRKKGIVPFRYFKVWNLAADFKTRIKDCRDQRIQDTLMFSVVQRLKNVKAALKKLNKEGFLTYTLKMPEHIPKW